MKMLAPVAVGALVVGVVLSGWARSAGRGGDSTPETQPAGPTQPAKASPPPRQSAPTQSAPITPAAPAVPKSNSDLPGPVGLDVRYLDSEGEIKHLDVKDFPR